MKNTHVLLYSVSILAVVGIFAGFISKLGIKRESPPMSQ